MVFLKEFFLKKLGLKTISRRQKRCEKVPSMQRVKDNNQFGLKNISNDTMIQALTSHKYTLSLELILKIFSPLPSHTKNKPEFGHRLLLNYATPVQVIKSYKGKNRIELDVIAQSNIRNPLQSEIQLQQDNSNQCQTAKTKEFYAKSTPKSHLIWSNGVYK